MNTDRQFSEVGSSSTGNPRWEPHKNENNPSYPKTLDGYFKDIREMPGNNGRPFYPATIVTVNPDGSLGQACDISGGKVLEEKLQEIPLGSFIRIEFCGKVRGKNTSVQPYNMFKVYVDPNAIPFAQLGGTVKHQPAQQVQQQAAPAPFNPGNAFQPQQSFQQPVQTQQANPFQQAQPPVQQNPFQTQQQPAQPVQQQTWTPPPAQQSFQQPVQTQQANPFQQAQPPVQQKFAQPSQGQTGHVFGGQQISNDDLPF